MITFVGSSLAEAAATNGGNATITLGSGFEPNDVSIVTVTLGTSRAISAASSRTVTSSGGAIYTQIVPTVTSSGARFSVWRRVLPSSQEVQAIVQGTAGASDATAAVAMVFRGVDSTSPEDVTPTSTQGGASAPDSPSITVTSCSCVIITAVGGMVNDATVTAPSSFLNQIDINANDTWDATTAMAWITLASTAAFDPANWTLFSNCMWGSATIALRPFVAASTSNDLMVWSQTYMPINYPVEMIGY